MLNFSKNYYLLYKFLFSTGLQRLDIIGASPRALDVVNLLDSHVVLLPGGRDPNGHPLVTFPNIGSLREKVGREDYKKVLHYLASITRLVNHMCCRNLVQNTNFFSFVKSGMPRSWFYCHY